VQQHKHIKKNTAMVSSFLRGQKMLKSEIAVEAIIILKKASSGIFT